MKLGDLLGFGENPLYQFFDTNRQGIGGALSEFGQGDMADAAKQGSQLDEVLVARKAAEAERQQAIAEAAQQKNVTMEMLKAKFPDLATAVEGGLPIKDAYNELFKRMSPDYSAGSAGANDPNSVAEYKYYVNEEMKAGRKPVSYMDFQTQKGGVSEMSLTPTYGKDPATGKIVLGQLGKDGQFHPTEMGGVEALSPYDLNAQKSGGTVDAKTAATARAALPGAEQMVKITTQAIDTILADTKGQAENFGNTLGIPNQLTWTMPGSPKANFWNNVQQAQGGAFLQARQWLKGQGAITELESAKAEGAMSAMEMAAKTGDQVAFQRAVMEFRQAVADGYEKLKMTAGGDYAAGDVPGLAGGTPQQPAAGGGGGFTILGVE